MQYRFSASRYDISCRRVEAITTASIVLDGIEIEGDTFALVNDAQVHLVTLNYPHSSCSTML